MENSTLNSAMRATGFGSSQAEVLGSGLPGTDPSTAALTVDTIINAGTDGETEAGADMDAADLEEVTSGRMRRVYTAEQLRTIEEGVRLILTGLGENLEREGIKNTPQRVARMYAALCSGHEFTPTTFENTQNYAEMVLVRGIQFYSLCEHHLMPFFGTATVAYIPSGRLIGLSKIGRIVEQFARRLQLQEQLTEQIAQSLQETLSPRGVGVFVRAEHLCMSARGVEKPGHQTHTFSLHGCLKDEPYRTEFLRQCECYRN